MEIDNPAIEFIRQQGLLDQYRMWLAIRQRRADLRLPAHMRPPIYEDIIDERLAALHHQRQQRRQTILQQRRGHALQGEIVVDMTTNDN